MRFPALVVLAVLLAGCALDPPATPTPGTTTPATSPTGGATPTPPPTPTGPPPAPREAPAFDGERALAHVRAQVLRDDGTVRHRVPGTEGNAEVARLVADEMTRLGYAVTWHHFNATYGCKTTPMHNVVAERAGASPDAPMVVFAAHYDTRPIADKDPDEARRALPIAGANDGGSGVGVLLELARVLDERDEAARFVFFDGEDGGGYGGSGCTDWILGSRAYAATLGAEERARIAAFILVDMVGDPALRIPWEGHSRRAAPDLLDRIYAVANGLGHRQFVNATGFTITDDHVPFVEAGIPAVDLIHLTDDGRVFPATHHTHADDLANVSAASLDAVGETLERFWEERG